LQVDEPLWRYATGARIEGGFGQPRRLDATYNARVQVKCVSEWLQLKVRLTYIAPLPHMPPQRRCPSHTGSSYSLGRSSSPRSRTLACSQTVAP